MWEGGRWAQVSEGGVRDRRTLILRGHKAERQTPREHEDVTISRPRFSKADLSTRTSALGARQTGRVGHSFGTPKGGPAGEDRAHASGGQEQRLIFRLARLHGRTGFSTEQGPAAPL